MLARALITMYLAVNETDIGCLAFTIQYGNIAPLEILESKKKDGKNNPFFLPCGLILAKIHLSKE